MKDKEVIDTELMKEACEAFGVEAAIDDDGTEGILIPKSYTREQIEELFHNIGEYVKHRKNLH